MFGVDWETSERKYDLISEELLIPISDGIQIHAIVFRPKGSPEEKFPAILSIHPYSQVGQYLPIKPTSMKSIVPAETAERPNASLEAGDPRFYVRRGYAHIFANVRGTGKSGGYFEFLGKREIQDIYEVIEFIAKQNWCSGNVGMFGVSYFAMVQFRVASLNPPHLKCIFAPWAATDEYRDRAYHGGILSYRFAIGLCKTSLTYSSSRYRSVSLLELGKEKYERALFELSKDEDIMAEPDLANIVKHPDDGFHPQIIDMLIHSLDDSYWKDRGVGYENIKVPAYIGADWGMQFLHLPAAFRSWDKLKVPKRLVVGPPVYLDRPVYQMQYESLRWFDYYLKGVDTGITKEAPVELFVMGENRWKKADSWPLPETKWTPFYLHEGELLSEHETWPNEGSDSYFDSPWGRGSLSYFTPPLVEDTEVIGPIVLNLYASSTDVEVLFAACLLEERSDGEQSILTRGWLRGSHRQIVQAKSKPWLPFHSHSKVEPLVPDSIYKFQIALNATAMMFKAGERIGLSISSVDSDITKTHGNLSHLRRQNPSRITIQHNDQYPSNLLLPITAGNLIGTYFSGGEL